MFEFVCGNVFSGLFIFMNATLIILVNMDNNYNTSLKCNNNIMKKVKSHHS